MDMAFAGVLPGDISAQIAANNTGASRVEELFVRYGEQEVMGCINEILDYSERRMRKAIRGWKNGKFMQMVLGFNITQKIGAKLSDLGKIVC